jgi:hypothetical protein
MAGLIRREHRTAEPFDVFGRFDRLLDEWTRMLPLRMPFEPVVVVLHRVVCCYGDSALVGQRQPKVEGRQLPHVREPAGRDPGPLSEAGLHGT